MDYKRRRDPGQFPRQDEDRYVDILSPQRQIILLTRCWCAILNCSLLQVGSLLHSTKTDRCQITTVTLAGSTRQAMRHSPTVTHLRATSQRRTFLSVAPTIFCRGLELWYKSMALIGSNLISRASWILAINTIWFWHLEDLAFYCGPWVPTTA